MRLSPAAPVWTASPSWAARPICTDGPDTARLPYWDVRSPKPPGQLRRTERRRGYLPAGPAPTGVWSKESGPGTVTFADPKALITTATFSELGTYVLKLTVTNGESTHSSTLRVSVEAPPPAKQLEAVYTKNFKISSPFWNARAKSLIVNWIPHCIDQINRDDLTVGPGGIDNFINAGKALRGEPHGYHKGYVFSNAWVHQTVEAMSIALMIDPQGDPEILKAHEKFRKTLDTWIPIILAAQEPDGYLQTAFTAAAPRRAPMPPVPVTKADGTVVLARVTVIAGSRWHPPRQSRRRPRRTRQVRQRGTAV